MVVDFICINYFIIMLYVYKKLYIYEKSQLLFLYRIRCVNRDIYLLSPLKTRQGMLLQALCRALSNTLLCMKTMFYIIVSGFLVCYVQPLLGPFYFRIVGIFKKGMQSGRVRVH